MFGTAASLAGIQNRLIASMRNWATNSGMSGTAEREPSATGTSASSAWDPARYLRFAGERARPFVDLVARVDAEAPATVVDLGCGEGSLTALLARRWPAAHVTGVDASPEMLAAAAQHAIPGRVEFVRGDV